MCHQQHSKLRNIGPVSLQWLAEVGVESRDDLRRVGVVETYAMVRSRRGQTSLNLLWALEAALRDIDWRELPEAAKNELRRQLDELTA